MSGAAIIAIGQYAATWRGRLSTGGAGAPALLAVVLLMSEAAAQTVLPPSAGATRPQRELEAPPVPKSVPQRVVPLKRGQMVPAGAADVTFTFQALRIEGAATLPVEEVRALWPHEAGTVVAVKEVFVFANAITRLYAEAGYALSFGVVPEQQIENGVVTVRVVEGFVARIEFVGDKVETPAESTVRRWGERIAAKILRSRPLRTADLERYVLLINDLPGIEVAATLTASPDTPGGSTLRIEITEHERGGAAAAYDNFLPESLDRQVAGGTVWANGLKTGAGQIRFGAQRGVQRDAYWSVSGDVSTGIGTEGLKVGVSGFYSKSDPRTVFLSSLEYLGQTTFASVHASYPLIRRRSKNLTIGGAAALSNAKSDILASRLTRDRLRTVEAFAAFDFADRTQAINYVRVAGVQGLDVLDATGNSRANGDVDYTAVTLDAQTDRPLFATPAGLVALRLMLRGQATVGSNAVFSAAECGFGGRQFGRGFEPSILLGDHCVLGAAEMRVTRPLREAEIDIYGFVDGGLIRQKGALQPGELRERTAASAGGGVRLRLEDRIAGMAEASWPIKDPTGVEGLVDDFRFNTSVRVRF